MIDEPEPIVYLITEGLVTAANFESEKQRVFAQVRRASGLNVTHIQIREKSLPAGLLLQLVSETVDLAKETPIKILVNERVDIAIAAKAHGVHLPTNSFPVAEVKKIKANFIVAASTHTLSELISAKENGVDFAVFGPIFSTQGKGMPVGLECLSEVCEKLEPFPVVALGGISKANKQSVLDSGASGFAAIRYFSKETQ